MSKRVVIVDWLGRGGIAQSAESWRESLRGCGVATSVVSRSGSEIESCADDVFVQRPRVGGSVRWHLEICRAAASLIRLTRPDGVVLQNYLLPPMELGVVRAAQRTGATLAVVVHNATPHEIRTGVSVGLDQILRRADVCFAHSNFVASALPRARSVRVLPLPLPVWLSREGFGLAPERRSETPTLLQFGVMNRAYKGAGILAELAAGDDVGWRYRVAGAGARGVPSSPRLSVHDGFLPVERLLAEVAAASAVAAPYRRATQSAVVSLAQALGRPPIAHAVGGVPEQIVDGVDGILLSADAGVQRWSDVLCELATHPDRLVRLGRGGVARTRRNHGLFVNEVRSWADEI